MNTWYVDILFLSLQAEASQVLYLFMHSKTFTEASVTSQELNKYEDKDKAFFLG